jgi:hypothetical protein
MSYEETTVFNFVRHYVNVVVIFSKMENENLVTTLTTFLFYGDLRTVVVSI